MKISIHKGVLLEPLMKVSIGTSSKNVLPILSGILFLVDNDDLTLVSGDTSFFIKTKIPAVDFKIIKPGGIIIPAKEITGVIKRMPDKIIDIEADGTSVRISSGKTKMMLRGLESEMFPVLPDEPKEHYLQIPGKDLKELIRMTSFAVYKKEDFPIGTGIKISFSDSGLKFTACDRNRFAIVTDTARSEIEGEVVISADNMHKISSTITDGDTITMSQNESMMIIESKKYTMYSKMLEGKYPPIERLLDSTEYAFANCRKSDVIEALERSMITAEKNEQGGFVVRLSLIGNEIGIQSENNNYEQTQDFVETESASGGKIIVGINGKYMLEALKALKDDIIKIRFAGEGKPIVISNGDEDMAMYLICLMRIREDA